MREIKFRAWDGKDKMMYCNIQNGIKFDDGSEYTFDNFLNPKDGDYHNWQIMQYTGLKDKNGKKIFEGDIVKSEVWAGEAYSVSFNRGGFCFGNGDKNYLHDAKYLESFEVIGNIYENPELLDNQEGNEPI